MEGYPVTDYELGGPAEIFVGPPERPWRTNNAEIAAKLRAADEAYAEEVRGINNQFPYTMISRCGWMARARSIRRGKAANALAMAYIGAALS